MKDVIQRGHGSKENCRNTFVTRIRTYPATSKGDWHVRRLQLSINRVLLDDYNRFLAGFAQCVSFKLSETIHGRSELEFEVNFCMTEGIIYANERFMG